MAAAQHPTPVQRYSHREPADDAVRGRISPTLRPIRRVRFAGAAIAALGCVLAASGCGTSTSNVSPVVQPTQVTGHPTPASGSGPVVLRDASNRTTVHVPVGSQVELVLSSSYWQVAGSSAPSLLTQDAPTHALPRPSTCPGLAGLGCSPEETLFTAKAAGTAVITASRTSCGEAMKCAPDQEKFSVTVDIG